MLENNDMEIMHKKHIVIRMKVIKVILANLIEYVMKEIPNHCEI